MDKRKIKDKNLPVGFTFSFPCRQSKIDEVRVPPSEMIGFRRRRASFPSLTGDPLPLRFGIVCQN